MTYKKLPFTPLLCAGVVALTGCGSQELASGPEISRTQYGVVHIKAENYKDLGLGFGFSHAQDNICLMAEYRVKVRGERSKYFGIEGAQAKNIAQDFYARYYYDGEILDRVYAKMSQKAQDLLTGYVDGYNRYLKHTPSANLPEACRDKPWLVPMTLTDAYRMIEDRNVIGSGQWFSTAMVGAAPPSVEQHSFVDEDLINGHLDGTAAKMGSNAWAFGRDVTENKRGLVVGNPHFPWQGSERFYQMHLTIPGEYDAMGTTLPPFPVVSIGFNRDVAWSHTVSTARRFAFSELTLDPQDPLAYMLDGEKQAMKKFPVSIEVKQPNGEMETREHVFYETRLGVLFILPEAGLVWNTSKAYAFGDANRYNIGGIETWLKVGQSKTVAEVKSAIGSTMSFPWVNTIAADRHGDALYADFSHVPNVSKELLEECAPSAHAAAVMKARRLFILNGEKSACNWVAAKNSPGGRLIAPKDAPSVVRGDYVANSNDSYWLINGEYRFAEKSPLFGTFEAEQGLRTRRGIIELSTSLKSGKISLATARQMQFRNANYAAELILSDFLSFCREGENKGACDVLAAWDRRENLDSRGAVLFRELWRKVRRMGLDELFVVPFDVADAVNTPRQLNVKNPDIRKALLGALDGAVKLITEKGFALDAPLGDVQVYLDKGVRIPLHGGNSSAGVLNVLGAGELSKQGYFPRHGASYIQIVTFDEDGPLADGVLAYGQSANPASSHYGDQTRVYSSKELYRLPFHRKDILNDPGYHPVPLPE